MPFDFSSFLKTITGGAAKSGSSATGLSPTPSPKEKANLDQMRSFREEMLAALRERMGNGLATPQLGAPAWAGYRPPVGPGTSLAGQPGAPVAGPVAIGGRAPAVSGFAAPTPSPAMAAEIERIKRERMLQALRIGPGNGIGLG